MLTRFYSILSSIQEPLQIMMVKEPLGVQMGNEVKHLQTLKTHMSSTEPLDYILERQGYDFFLASDIPKFHAKTELLKHVILENGKFAKCFTLYSLSSILSPAWIHSLFQVSNMIILGFVPIEQDKAVSKLRRKIHMMQATQSTNPKIVNQLYMAGEAANALEKNSTKMMTVTVNVLVQGDDLKSLKEATKKFNKQIRISLSGFDNTSTNQAKMLGGWGKKLYVELAPV